MTEVDEFVSWLESLDLDEIENYRRQLDAYATDTTDRLGAFAAAALPLVVGVQIRTTMLERFIRPAWAQAFPDDGEPDLFFAHLLAINRAARELDGDGDPLAILDAALATSRAARARDDETDPSMGPDGDCQ